jgi:hypothetical protein
MSEASEPRRHDVISATTATSSPSPTRTHTVFTSDPLSDFYRQRLTASAFLSQVSCRPLGLPGNSGLKGPRYN